MNNTHTPGPWIVDGKANLPFRKTRDTGQPLRAVHSTSGLPIEVALVWVDNEAGEANARLIAVAPVLLAAVTEALKCVRYFHDHVPLKPGHRDYLERIEDTLDDAIPKTTGEGSPD